MSTHTPGTRGLAGGGPIYGAEDYWLLAEPDRCLDALRPPQWEAFEG